jgi:hypothetical protein
MIDINIVELILKSRGKKLERYYVRFKQLEAVLRWWQNHILVRHCFLFSLKLNSYPTKLSLFCSEFLFNILYIII